MTLEELESKSYRSGIIESHDNNLMQLLEYKNESQQTHWGQER